MSDNQPEVIVEVRGRYGYLTLNRPKGLNALTLDMVQKIHRQLDSWAGDDAIEAVVFLGAGDKAFCAGGDIRALYDSYQSGDTLHRVFFEEEYSLDQAIHQYPKPVLSVMNGIVMGGGMGVAQGASLRIVSDRAKLAMPETGIGYFPDVGATYFLGRLPGRLGSTWRSPERSLTLPMRSTPDLRICTYRKARWKTWAAPWPARLLAVMSL